VGPVAPNLPSALRCGRPSQFVWLCCSRIRALCIVVRGDPQAFLSLFLFLLFANFPALRDIHEAPHHVAVLKNPPACDASRLRRLESSRIASLFWGAWPAASSAGARPEELSALSNRRLSLVCESTCENNWGGLPRLRDNSTRRRAQQAKRSGEGEFLRLQHNTPRSDNESDLK
jgi:hypothetical protein